MSESVAPFHNFTTSVEQRAACVTFVETLPKRSCFRSSSPVAPITIRSYSPLSASPRISSAGSPSVIIKVAERPCLSSRRRALKLILEGAIRERSVEVGEGRRIIEPLAVESQVNPRSLRHTQQCDFRFTDLKR